VEIAFSSHWFRDACLVGVLGISASTDIASGRIYNVVTYPAIVTGILIAVAGLGPGLASSMLGAVVGGGAVYIMFAMGFMGGGDVKLMAAVGSLVGVPAILTALFYSIFAGGVFAALILIWRGEVPALAKDLWAVVTCVTGPSRSALAAVPSRGGTFPFGVAITIGTLVAVALERTSWRWPL